MRMQQITKLGARNIAEFNLCQASLPFHNVCSSGLLRERKLNSEIALPRLCTNSQIGRLKKVIVKRLLLQCALQQTFCTSSTRVLCRCDRAASLSLRGTLRSTNRSSDSVLPAVRWLARWKIVSLQCRSCQLVWSF